ncbi:tetratricopeptide repeat protein [Chitinophaga pinensis]|uniref:Tetratricopeptide domain protein n=1 Tax=Chitinophaga pinensis (strain ATCC 43595 / DSM 2588 / LMG 13176 / NBRC 15968 / NCIMB 11800 / UQM 2034) TaxID=485918 RepID=A0A979G028_CHIPD|nr:tetratricopeptide repeat protein [Chitinophaga pinensis]ACU58330.1 Tetratricopeptide domain protein [Chitinophaga pinensis DSM 2588]
MRYVLLLAVGISLFACTSPTNKTKTNTEEQPGKSAGLTEAQIFEKDIVLKAAQNSKGKNKVSDKYFLDGVDMYRNQKNPAKAIELFKQAIFEQPQARAYFELGNALADEESLSDAASAYQLAEALDYKPTSKVLYNLACVYSRAKDRKSAEYYLVSAIEFGYSNVKNIFADKDLEFLRSTEGFNMTVTTAISGATDPSKLQWNLFWHEFKPVAYPLVLDERYGDKLGEDYISYEYERFVAEMRDNEKFSREVGFEFYHVGLAKNSDSIKTLIYAVRNVIMGGTPPPEYYIVSYDGHGKLIDKLLIGGHKKLSEPFRVAKLSENGNIEVGLFTQVYKKNPEEEGYEDNELVENKFLNKEFYAIAGDGHFVKKDALLGMRF